MANSNTNSKARSKSSNKGTVKKVQKEQEPVSVKEQKPIVARDIDPEQYVVVRNGFQGKLVYRSPHTGETFIWEEFGDEQEMQLRELKNAKNSSKKFFINNWFMFDDDWVVDYLGVRQYYKNAVRIEDFDNIFSLPADQLKKEISEMSSGQKKSIRYRAVEMISNQEIDSLKTITALEEALGVDLIEK